jgi:dihydroneopterin aldolase
MDSIFLQGVVLRGYHGVYEEETRLGQRFIIDMTCYLDFASEEIDELSKTVSYENLYATLEEIVTGKPFHLIETLAEHIANSMFENYKRIQKVDVRVTKPEAPLPMVAGQVGIAISRERHP